MLGEGVRQADRDKEDILSDCIFKSLELMDKYMTTDKFDIICSIIDYLNTEQDGYIPFHPCEFE